MIKTSKNFDFGEVYKTFAIKNKRYKILKGSKASRKSTVIAAYCLIKILSNNTSNILCIRHALKGLRTSSYPLLKKVAREYLDVYHLFDWKDHDLKIIKKRTGQLIDFKGLQNPEDVGSIAASTGVFDTVWLEEAYEVRTFEIWIKIEGCFRGTENLEFIMSFNPWNKMWIYEEFFRGRLEDDITILEKKGWQIYEDDEHLLMITNHRINHYLTTRDHYNYVKYKNRYPKIYNVVSLGAWGNIDMAVYNTLDEDNIISETDLANFTFSKICVGIDFALVNDSTAIAILGVAKDKTNEPKIIFLDEWKFSNSGRTIKLGFNEIVANVIMELRKFADKYPLFKQDRIIYVENQEGGAFKEALKTEGNKLGLHFVFRDCVKAPVTERVMIYRYLMGENKFLFTNNCVKAIYEFQSSTYDLHALKNLNIFKREDGNDDLINASEYSLSGIWNILLSYYTKNSGKIYG